tara:strand:- start:524 stop:682 length:159 start_codon:yes stop_codon:yes gene_type:complete
MPKSEQSFKNMQATKDRNVDDIIPKLLEKYAPCKELSKIYSSNRAKANQHAV